jgi:thioesterase domain-containing protein
MNIAENGGSIVFLPDFGGNVIYAQPVQKVLANEFSCFGSRLAPDMVEKLDELSLVDIAERFAADIHQSDIPRPIHICGFSFAGLLAFETARHLSELGERRGELLILDTRIRHRKFLARLISNPLQEILYAGRYLMRNWRAVLPGLEEPLILHRYGQIRMDLGNHAEAHRVIIRQMYDKMAVYYPRPWEGSASVFRASEIQWGYRLDDLGWGRLIGNSICFVDVPGDHLSMLRNAENAAVLADRMNFRLKTVQKELTDV